MSAFSPDRQTLQDPEKVRNLFGRIARRYDVANRLLSGFLDEGWRRKVCRQVAAEFPRDILDLATGSGDLGLALERACPGAQVVGADFCVPMLERAQAKDMRLLVAADGLALPFAGASFDAVTVAFGLRNMADWHGALSEMRRILKPNGWVYVLDFSLPESWLRPVYRFYLHRMLPHVAAAITGQKDAYEYLGQSIEDFPRGEEMLRLLEAAGFTSPSHCPLALGIVGLYKATRPGAVSDSL